MSDSWRQPRRILIAALGTGRAVPRDAFAFYTLATLVIMVLCMGPQIRSGTRVVMESAPYGWLMALPGFDGLRVPTRFWMLGTLCLAVAAALGLDRLLPRSRFLTVAVIPILSAGVLADGWAGAMPMARAPERWTVEHRETERPLIELPLGPEFDAAPAVLFGPDTRNFRDVVELMMRAAAARVVQNAAELTEAEFMHTVFPHPTLSEMMHESVLSAYGKAIHF